MHIPSHLQYNDPTAGPCDGDPLLDAAKDAVIEDSESAVTNCCGAPFMFETDFCSDCHEHAAASLTFQHGWDRYENPIMVTVEFDRHTNNLISIESEV
jgi:hypothetical protein